MLSIETLKYHMEDTKKELAFLKKKEDELNLRLDSLEEEISKQLEKKLPSLLAHDSFEVDEDDINSSFYSYTVFKKSTDIEVTDRDFDGGISSKEFKSHYGRPACGDLLDMIKELDAEKFPERYKELVLVKNIIYSK